MKSGLKVTLGVGLLLVAVAAVKIHKRQPPYEQGIHEATVSAEGNPARADAPRAGNCPVFPADNVWNATVDSLPLDAHSATYVESIGPAAHVHADFGSNLASGIPYTFVQPSTPSVAVKFDYSGESDLGHYPIPADAPIEGAPATNGDRHVILIEQRRCILYEMWRAFPQPDGSWKAGSGIKMDLNSNALRTDGKTSADAAGLPIFPGLVRYEEVKAGAINHALRFTVPHTRKAYIWPARHMASRSVDPMLPPMGQRFRLKASFDVSGFSVENKVILKALKQYGMILADNGSAIFISGVPDKRWDDTDLHRLGRLAATDFEVVDETHLQMLSDSGRVDPLEKH